MIQADNADQLFENVMNELLNNNVNLGNISHEIVNANLALTDPTQNTMCECSRKMPIRYAIGELLWYNSRSPRWETIYPFSKFWKKLSNDDGTVESNYGWCIHDKFDFDQWEYCRNLLSKYPDTRQAIIHIKEPRNLLENPTKDCNCTLTLQFLLRDNSLDLIVNMRSNDVWLGLPYDVFNFTCMQIQMAMELNVNIGTYYHNVGSLHMYHKDFVRYKGVNND